MENKNSDDSLKKSATLTRFEEIIGRFNELKSQLDVANRINERLREQVSVLETTQTELIEKNKELRKQLREEKERSDAKITLDDFHAQLASVMNKTELGDIEASESWKTLLDVLIEEVENCIRLVEYKQSENE